MEAAVAATAVIAAATVVVTATDTVVVAMAEGKLFEPFRMTARW